MAKVVYKNSYVAINGVDLSNRVREVSIESTRPEVDATTMGATYAETLYGIPDATWTITFAQDFAGGSTHATLNALGLTDTPFSVAWRPQNAAISAINPEAQMTALSGGYSPVAGGIGDLATIEMTFRNASQTGIVYDVTP